MKRAKPLKKFHIGPRTMKTAVAIIISLAIVNQYGASSAKLIFACWALCQRYSLRSRALWRPA